MYIFIIYFVIINIIGYAAMWWDKRMAVRHRWRISESTLMSIAIAFGSLGIMLGMRSFNHKTRHAKFSIGVPLIFAAELIIAVFMFVV